MSYLWPTMKNGLRKPANSLSGLLRQREPSWLLQKAVPGPGHQGSPQIQLCAHPSSSCCPAPLWWTVPQSHPSHEYSADEQINAAALKRAVLRGYKTFAQHKNVLCFCLFGQRIKEEKSAPWTSSLLQYTLKSLLCHDKLIVCVKGRLLLWLFALNIKKNLCLILKRIHLQILREPATKRPHKLFQPSTEVWGFFKCKYTATSSVCLFICSETLLKHAQTHT